MVHRFIDDPELGRIIIPRENAGRRGFPRGFGFLGGQVLFNERFLDTRLSKLQFVCTTLAILGEADYRVCERLKLKPWDLFDQMQGFYEVTGIPRASNQTPLLRACLTTEVMHIIKFGNSNNFPVNDDEVETIDDLSYGYTYAEVADMRGRSKNAIKRQLAGIRDQTEISGTPLMVAGAILTGLIDREAFEALSSEAGLGRTG
jgi:DNA-binding CsgD family transcriptional regulator